MQNEIQNLVDSIVADYYNWQSKSSIRTEVHARMLDEFINGIEVVEGRKYIKILKKLGSQTMVWGFVVNVDNDKKFRKGDILMAAGYGAPARNAARGNILDGDFDVSWTGPKYL
jgi:hypothetical protein